MFLLKKIKKLLICCCGSKWFSFKKKKKKIFEIMIEYLKLISRYFKCFADSSKKLTAIVMFLI